MQRAHRFLGLAAGLLVASIAARAQTFPFQLRVTQGTTSTIIANNATLSLGADAVGKSTTVTVTAIYRGATAALIPQAPDVVGSPDITVANLPTLPITINPGSSISFDIVYKPSTAASVGSQIALPYVDLLANPQPNGPIGTAGTIGLAVTGVAPQLSVNYLIQPDANIIPLQDGSTLLFPDTLVNTTSTATVVVANRGSGPGVVKDIAISGSSAFLPQGLPFLPLSIASGSTAQFNIRYSPKVIETSKGSLAITFADKTITVNLEGSATGSTFSYQLLLDSGTVAMQPNQSVALPDIQLGSTLTATIQVRNVGNGDGTINSVGLVGQGFTITDAPFLPQTLKPNDIIQLTFAVNPTVAGNSKARLRIGNDSFELSTNVIGSKLTYSYTGPSGSPVTVLPGGAVLFSPLQVSLSSSSTFHVQNDGTAPATITSIGIVEARTGFSLKGLPTLPLTLNPKAGADFTIVFAPTTVGFTSATLRLDTQSFVLSGSGNAPPDLPAYTFSGASDTVDPASQPAVSLKLASPYPLPLTGTLTLLVDSGSLTNDPAVQFTTGSRSVSFTIPANTTDAVFPNDLLSVRLQTGTVATTIVLKPTFTTQSGIDVTPASPAVLRLNVARLAPKIISGTVSRTTNTVSVAVVAYTTTRSLTKLNVQFTAQGTATVPNLSFTLDISRDATAWFTSSSSQGTGGQFVITIPFTFTGTAAAGTNLSDVVKSVSVALSNEVGDSSPLSLDIH